LQSKINDPKYNPTLKLIFDLYDIKDKPLSENFIIVDYKKGKQIERNKPIEIKVSELNIVVAYICRDENCTIQPEDRQQYEDNIFYYLDVKSTYFDYNLFKKDEPVFKNEDKYHNCLIIFNLFIGHLIDNYWQVVEVTEEKGIIENLFGLEEKKINWRKLL